MVAGETRCSRGRRQRQDGIVTRDRDAIIVVNTWKEMVSRRAAGPFAA